MGLNSPGVALGVALTGSVALNASYLLQRAGTRHARAIDARRPVRTARALLGSRAWLAGLSLGLAGWALYITALAHAPLSLVQAFAAGGLAVAVPAAAAFLGEPPTRGDGFTVGATIAALALLGVGAVHSHPVAVPAGPMAAFLAVAAAAALAALRVHGAARGRALAAAGGMLYGAADAATKAVAIAAQGDVRGSLTGPWAACVVAATAGAFLCFQRALQLGPAVRVIALMTAATNATAMAGGLLVFDDPLGRTAPLALLHAGGLAVAALSGLGLGATQARLAAAAETRSDAARGPWRPPPRLLRAVLAWGAVPVAVVAGLGWLYLVRDVGALALGPGLAGALPLEQLAHHAAQPLPRLVVAWIPAGAAAAAALVAGTRTSRAVRALAVGLAGWVVLVIGGAVSDAVAVSSGVAAHLSPQLARPGTLAATVLLVLGALAVPGPLADPGSRRAPGGIEHGCAPARTAAATADGRAGRRGRAQGRPRWSPTSRSATGVSRRQTPQSWPPG